MTAVDAFTWIQNTPIPTAIRESPLLFPWIEAAHVVGGTLVFGFVSIIDFRLLGLLSKSQPVSRVTDDMVPWVWGAFAISLVSGLLLFSSNAVQYISNIQFLWKMALLITAGFNMLFFHLLTYRGVDRWDDAIPPPPAVRIAGGASLLLWMSVITFGRWIGFTL
jgi:hypothetical protein